MKVKGDLVLLDWETLIYACLRENNSVSWMLGNEWLMGSVLFCIIDCVCKGEVQVVRKVYM